MSEEAPRCPECGYTEYDARTHGDHYLCKGTIPGPEKIFAWKKHNGRFWALDIPEYRNGKATPYTRTDLYEAATAERDALKAEVERLREIVYRCVDPCAAPPEFEQTINYIAQEYWKKGETDNGK